MKALLYKEFKLAIHPLYLLVALLSALLLVPQWPFFLALMYFMFITVPNVFTAGKASGDITFSAMMPVKKSDIVGARMSSIILLELVQLAVAGICAALRPLIYKDPNFLLEPNFAFFGFAFLMFAVFNAVFFPMFYKTAYKVGIPVILATAASVLFVVVVEAVVLIVPAVHTVLSSPQYTGAQVGVLAAGVALFAIFSFLTFKASARRFEKVDL